MQKCWIFSTFFFELQEEEGDRGTIDDGESWFYKLLVAREGTSGSRGCNKFVILIFRIWYVFGLCGCSRKGESIS